MNAILHDLRDALRTSLKNPGFAALVAGVLGAGLACVIFMLTLLDGFILRPLPFAKPDELLQAGFHGDGGLGDVFPVDSRDLAQIRRYLAGKADVAAAASIDDQSQRHRPPGALSRLRTSRRICSTCSASRRALGRDFSDEDAKPGAPAGDDALVLALASTLRRRSSDRRPRRPRRRTPATVIGVMPKDFTYPRNEDLWVPATIVEGQPADAYAYWVIARRNAGIGDADVATAFDSWFADAARADPNRFRGRTFRVEPLARMAADRTTRGTLGSMLAAVVMVLLVSCANAANLLLTRTLGRSQELAVRVALGASRRRLIAHLLAESLLLTFSATAIAFALARAGVTWQQGVDARDRVLSAVAAASTSTRRCCCSRSAPHCSPRSPPAFCPRFAPATSRLSARICATAHAASPAVRSRASAACSSSAKSRCRARF